jgi:hypothetical protein
MVPSGSAQELGHGGSMARRGPVFDVDITEGAIRVRSGGRTLTLHNEPPPADLDEEADFLIRLDEIEHWDAPHGDQSIEVEELQKILEAIEDKLESSGLSVIFE